MPVWLFGACMEKGNGKEDRFCFGNGFICVLITREARFSVRDGLVCLWEDSVRSSHHFLSEKDIQGLKPFVRSALDEIPDLWGVRDRCGRWVAFMGIHGVKLEMLFVDPSVQRKGLGRNLMQIAIQQRNVRQVDVNEENPEAIGFYHRMGFRLVGRSALDGQGNPFPLCHLLRDR